MMMRERKKTPTQHHTSICTRTCHDHFCLLLIIFNPFLWSKFSTGYIPMGGENIMFWHTIDYDIYKKQNAILKKKTEKNDPWITIEHKAFLLWYILCYIPSWSAKRHEKFSLIDIAILCTSLYEWNCFRRYFFFYRDIVTSQTNSCSNTIYIYYFLDTAICVPLIYVLYTLHISYVLHMYGWVRAITSLYDTPLLINGLFWHR